MKNAIHNIEAIFLDFDGVVVESAAIKTQAFYDLYFPYGEEIAAVAKNYHLKNQGISRYKKFSTIHEKYLNKTCDIKELESLSKQFSKIVLKKILTAPLVCGVLEFLKKMSTKKVPVFLLSATPHDELIVICNERNLSIYFQGVYGAPNKKHEKGEAIIQAHGFDRKKVIFIGDSISDFRASQQIQVKFIGRVCKEDITPFGSQARIIENFQELLE